MVKKIAAALIDYQVKTGSIKISEKAEYMLGYQLLVGRILSAVLMLAIAFTTGTLSELFLFMMAFIFLRQYGGGLHLENEDLCVLLSGCVCAVFAVGIKNGWGRMPIPAWGIIETVMTLVIWHLAPVGTKNKKLDMKEEREFRVRSRWVLGIETVIFIYGIIMKNGLLWKSIAAAHIAAGGSLTLGYLVNHQNNKLENTDK